MVDNTTTDVVDIPLDATPDPIIVDSDDDDSFDLTSAELGTMFNIPEPMRPQPARKPGELTPTDFILDYEDVITCPANDIAIDEAFRIFKETYLDNFGYGVGVFAKAARMDKSRLKLLLSGRRTPTKDDMSAIDRGIEVLDAERDVSRGRKLTKSAPPTALPKSLRKHYR